MQNIPVIFVEGETIAETYEKALIKLYLEGIRIKTQYDKPEDPLSLDATVNLTIYNPIKDPMIHKCFPGSIADLREYVYELNGLKNNWVKNTNDPEDKRWEYLYSLRMTNYGQWKEKDENGVSKWMGEPINQVEYVINKLIAEPFTRQAQMVLWFHKLDCFAYDCPCLQSLHFRLLEENNVYYLNTNIRFRSNDFFGAFVMNIFGLTLFIKENIADELQKRLNKEVKMSRINWHADSWHIYGKDIQQFKERFIDRLETTKFEDRVYNFNDPDIQEMYHEEEKNILEKIAKNTKELEKYDSN